MACTYVSLFKFPQIWLKWWVEGEVILSRNVFIGIYFLLAAFCLLAVGATIGFANPLASTIVHFANRILRYYFVSIVPRFILEFHKTLLTTVISLPMAFLSATESGSLVNRFSQDIQLIDMSLPSATFVMFFGVLFCLSEIILISLGAKYIAAVIPLGLAFAYSVQKFYLLTSRQLRYLELEAKAPLYTSIIDTFQTLETVRAFGWQDLLRTHFARLLDLSQQPYYLLLCIQRWLTIVLDLFVAAVAVILVALSVQLKNTPTAGAIGVALVNVLSFNQSIANLVLAWTNPETSLGAIARLRSFVESTPLEPHGREGIEIGPEWPSGGRVRLTGVSATYGRPSEPVLRDINLDVCPGEHIAILGRTGSGKSTIIDLLLRLHEPTEGTILIDDIDVQNISPALLRHRIIGVSQEPIQPTGTLRSHLDPDKNHSDTALMSLLAKFGIAYFRGLDKDMAFAPITGGEAQLLFVMRAVLRRQQCAFHRGLLLLDEATSMLDCETENVALSVLENEFRGWTIVNIVHKTHLQRYATRIGHIQDGQISEDRPR